MLTAKTRRTTVTPAALLAIFSTAAAAPLMTPGLTGLVDLGRHPTPHQVRATTQVHSLRVAPRSALERAQSAPGARSSFDDRRAVPGPGDPRDAGSPGGAGELARATAGGLSDPAAVRSGLAVAGVTWRPGDLARGDHVELRVEREGVWGAWEEVHAEADHGPDPGTAEAARGLRAGSDPFVVQGDQVQARVLSSDATVPTSLSLTVVDPGTSDADAGVGTTPAGGAVAATAKPTIYTRAQWGADESIRQGSPGYSQAHVAFVHHTAGSNTYSQAQVPAIIRGIYAYHVKGNGWSDIGYNFLVDKFGRTWEGRYGGVDKAVIGAHTLGYNSWSFGTSVIGDYNTVAVPPAVTTALTNVIAWKMSLDGMPATGTVFAKDKYFNRISGHRDAVSTECPGAKLYALLPTLRRNVAARMGSLATTRLSRDVDRAGQADLLTHASAVTGAALGSVTLLTSATTNPFTSQRTLGSSWNTVRLATLSPDFTGDGRPDIVAQYPGAGNLRIYSGDGRGGIARMTSTGSGWNSVRSLIAAGDQNGDGHADLMAISSTGQLVLYPGTGKGTFTARTVVASGWGAYRYVSGAGDVTGDGHPDLLAVRVSDGALVLAPGDGRGHLGTLERLAAGWGGLTAVFAAGDLDGDGHGDIFGREPSGAMRVYYGDGSNPSARWNRWGSGWNSMAQMTSGVDFTGDGHPDLLGVATTVSNGSLRVYPGTGLRDLRVASTFEAPTGTDLVQLVGDVNGDGYVDAVVRVGDALQALPGRSGGGFGAPVMVGARGWAAMRQIAAAGDQDYDGIPDVLVITKAGLTLRYSFKRDFTMPRVEELEQGWGDVVSLAGVGAFNADANGDVVALRSDGTLQLFRGSGPNPLFDFTVLRSGQTDLTQILGVGDYNGDGAADIMAAGSSGRLWLYAGRGDGTLHAGRMPLSGGLGAGQELG